MGVEEIMVESSPPSWQTQPVLSLNHVSFVCKSVPESIRFYQDVLGFALIKRPSSFNFEGAWLFNNGIGIHLLEMEGSKVPAKKGRINPKDNHISFQCSDMRLLMHKLEHLGIEYVTAVVEEGGITVDQLFFHDPDGYMIEICNCENLPILPLIPSSCPLKKLPKPHHLPPSLYEKPSWEMKCAKDVEAMMTKFVVDMMGISF